MDTEQSEVITEEVTPSVPSVESDATGELSADGVANTGSESGQKEEQNGDQGEQPSKSRSAKARLRRKLGESEANNARLADDNRALHEKVDSLATQIDGVINPPAPRPSRVDYETEENYEDALHEFRTAAPSAPSPTPAPQAAVAPQAQPEARSPEQQKVVDTWMDNCDNAADKYEDFDEVIQNPKLPITGLMRDSMVEAQSGAEVAYHLGKNPKEAARIAALSPVQQVGEIAKLAGKFTSNVPSAPAPITPSGGNDTGAVIDVEKMSPAQYAAHRRGQGMV